MAVGTKQAAPAASTSPVHLGVSRLLGVSAVAMSIGLPILLAQWWPSHYYRIWETVAIVTTLLLLLYYYLDWFVIGDKVNDYVVSYITFCAITVGIFVFLLGVAALLFVWKQHPPSWIPSALDPFWLAMHALVLVLITAGDMVIHFLIAMGPLRDQKYRSKFAPVRERARTVLAYVHGPTLAAFFGLFLLFLIFAVRGHTSCPKDIDGSFLAGAVAFSLVLGNWVYTVAYTRTSEQ